MNAPAPPSALAHGSLTHRQTMWIVAGALLPVFMGSMDQSVVASALPTIGRSLGSSNYLSWVVAANLMMATAMTPLYGKISDIIGRRQTLLVSIGLYLVGSMISALADSLPLLMASVRQSDHPFIVFCDDLSFDAEDTSYKSLKAVLEGGIEGRPANVVFYATSNRRHLLPRDMMENERSSAINPGEAVEEKVSLSDRFGLWLGFHRCSQDDYLAMVFGYAKHFGLKASEEEIRAGAIEWSQTRGNRSGRTAWQFIQDLAGRLETRIG